MEQMINNTAIDLDVNKFEYEFEYMTAFLAYSAAARKR